MVGILLEVGVDIGTGAKVGSVVGEGEIGKAALKVRFARSVVQVKKHTLCLEMLVTVVGRALVASSVVNFHRPPM